MADNPTPNASQSPGETKNGGDVKTGAAPTVGIFRQLGLGAAGFWLMILITGSVFIAAIVFSATQFQTRLANLTLFSGPLSAWKADQLRDDWASSLEVLDAAKKAVTDKQLALVKSYAARNDLTEADLKAELGTNQVRYKLATKIAKIDKDLSDKTDRLNAYDFIQAIAPLLDGLKTHDKSIEQDVEDLKVQDEKWIEVRDQIKARDVEIASLNKEIDTAKTQLTAAKKNARFVITKPDGTIISDEQSIQIENTIYEFQQMNQRYYSVYYLVLAPSDVLVLLLVIAMGILGSSMQLTHVYLTEFGNKSILFYMFRPFLGVITAFVVFIATKTGLPLVTDVARSGGTATVNPYFISFLAIISGLLSENALQWMRQLGTSYFRDAEAGGPPRWAREDLTGKFTTANRDPKDVQSLLNAKDVEFAAWIKGKDPIPASAQAMLSAALGEPQRNLFTDFPPPEEGKPAAG